MTNITGSKLSIFSHPGKITGFWKLQDHFHIETHIARANMGLDFVSGQYGCLFSRCWKYVINSLIHGHLINVIFHRIILMVSYHSSVHFMT
jgi:hypothetical protein